uniref:Exocyst subunit Exo70 family protein n=1 Tax=Davidia involucrata TaxID=16924 RepID=A0A5B6ZGZ7_DAVIN
METSVPTMQVNGIEPSMRSGTIPNHLLQLGSGTISDGQRQSEANKKIKINMDGLMDQFQHIVVGATTLDLSSTTYSSSTTTGSSGPASFPMRQAVDRIKSMTGRMETLVSLMQVDRFEPSTISIHRRESESQVNEIELLTSATGMDLNSTYSSSMTGSTGRASFPVMETVDETQFQLSIGWAIISDNQMQSQANEIRQFEDILIRDTGVNSSSETNSNSITGPPDFKLLDEVYLCSYGALHKEAIDELRCIIENIAVHEEPRDELFECMMTYARLRKSFLDMSFRRLGIQKLSIKEVRELGWDTLEAKIKRWIRAARIFIRVLFASERRQSQQIFGGLGMDDACFVETVRDAATLLFDIAQGLSMIRPSPERLKTILHFHKDLSNLKTDVSYVFQSEESVEIIQIRETIQILAAQILSRLVEAVRAILPDFENSLLRELSTIQDPQGTIHPSTMYVMDYVGLILDNKEILTELIVLKPSSASFRREVMIPDVEYAAEVEGRTPLALHLIWIIVILRFNLEGKSMHCAEASLAHLFIMNNVGYIVRKMEESPQLLEMIGDDYLKKLAEDVQQAAASYLTSTLDRILYCFRDDGLEGSWWGLSSRVSKSALRERLKTFNSMFGEFHHTQARRVVPNLQLQEKLRLSILEKLIPAYDSFLGRFSTHIESRKHQETYIKYSVKVLETIVMNFFAFHSFL